MMRRWDEEVDAATAKAVGDYPDEEFDELLMNLPYLDLEEGLKKVHSELDAIYDLTKTYDDTLLEGGSVVFPSSTSPDGVVVFRLVEHLRVHYTNKALGLTRPCFIAVCSRFLGMSTFDWAYRVEELKGMPCPESRWTGVIGSPALTDLENNCFLRGFPLDGAIPRPPEKFSGLLENVVGLNEEAHAEWFAYSQNANLIPKPDRSFKGNDPLTPPSWEKKPPGTEEWWIRTWRQKKELLGKTLYEVTELEMEKFRELPRRVSYVYGVPQAWDDVLCLWTKHRLIADLRWNNLFTRSGGRLGFPTTGGFIASFARAVSGDTVKCMRQERRWLLEQISRERARAGTGVLQQEKFCASRKSDGSEVPVGCSEPVPRSTKPSDAEIFNSVRDWGDLPDLTIGGDQSSDLEGSSSAGLGDEARPRTCFLPTLQKTDASSAFWQLGLEHEMLLLIYDPEKQKNVGHRSCASQMGSLYTIWGWGWLSVVATCWCRRTGIPTRNYIDDFVSAALRGKSKRTSDAVFALLNRLGIRCSFRKKECHSDDDTEGVHLVGVGDDSLLDSEVGCGRAQGGLAPYEAMKTVAGFMQILGVEWRRSRSRMVVDVSEQRRKNTKTAIDDVRHLLDKAPQKTDVPAAFELLQKAVGLSGFIATAAGGRSLRPGMGALFLAAGDIRTLQEAVWDESVKMNLMIALSILSVAILKPDPTILEIGSYIRKVTQIFSDASLEDGLLSMAAIVRNSRDEPPVVFSWEGNAVSGEPSAGYTGRLPPYLRKKTILVYELIAVAASVFADEEAQKRVKKCRPRWGNVPSFVRRAAHSHVDNIGACYALLKGCSRCPYGSVLGARIAEMFGQRGLRPSVSYIRSSENIADTPTRKEKWKTFLRQVQNAILFTDFSCVFADVDDTVYPLIAANHDFIRRWYKRMKDDRKAASASGDAAQKTEVWEAASAEPNGAKRAKVVVSGQGRC